eukprot:1154586-Pelagomonas_calceolata.AAC.6
MGPSQELWCFWGYNGPPSYGDGPPIPDFHLGLSCPRRQVQLCNPSLPFPKLASVPMEKETCAFI